MDTSGWTSSRLNKQYIYIYIYKKVYNIFLVLQFSPSRFLHVWESSVVVEWGSFAIHCRKPWPKLVQIWSSVYSWLKCHRYNSSEKHDQHMMHNVVSFFMHLEFIPHGQTFKAQYYCKVLKHQRGNIRGNDLWMNCSATAVAHSALKRSPLNICPFSWDSLSQLSGLTGQVANNNDNNNIINYNNKWLVNLCQISIL